MSKPRSRLLPISLFCVVGLAAGPPLAKWQRAPWNQPLVRPLLTVTMKQMPWQLAFSPDGRTVTALAAEESLQRWTLDGREVFVNAAPEDVLSPDGREQARIVVRTVVSGRLMPRRSLPRGRIVPYRSHQLDLVDVSTGARRHSLALPGNLHLSNPEVRYAPGGAVIFLHASDTLRQFMAAWDTGSGRLLWSRVLDRDKTGPLVQACLSPGGRACAFRLAPSGRGPNFSDGPVELSDMRTGARLFQINGLNVPPTLWTFTASSPRSTLFAAKSSISLVNGTSPLYVWDMKRRRLVWQWSKPSSATNGCFSPDERLLALCTSDSDEIVIVDAWTGRRLAILNDSTALSRVQLRVRQKRAVLASQAPSLQGWLRPDGERAVPLTLTWSPDGRRLAAGYSDKTIKVWAVPQAP